MFEYYNEYEVDTCLTNYYNSTYVNTHVDSTINSSNTYTQSDVGDIINILGISSMLTIINANGINIADMSDTRYTKSEVDNLINNIYIYIYIVGLIMFITKPKFKLNH